MPKLAEVLREEFTDTQLHGFIVAAEHPDNRGATHWEALRKAAIEAANCADCATSGRH